MRLTRRTFLVTGLAFCFAALCFSLGAWYTQRRFENRIAAALRIPGAERETQRGETEREPRDQKRASS